MVAVCGPSLAKVQKEFLNILYPLVIHISVSGALPTILILGHLHSVQPFFTRRAKSTTIEVPHEVLQSCVSEVRHARRARYKRDRSQSDLVCLSFPRLSFVDPID
jgi:hypothetical protein